jgi:hypothetical protein
MADLPGGASGMLVRGHKNKKADRLVTRIAPGVFSLVAELRGHERQAAEELGRWKYRVEERKTLPPRRRRLRSQYCLTDEELDSLEKRARDGEDAVTRTTRWIRCRKPSTGCAPW